MIFMKNKKPLKNKRLLQGMGLGYVMCLITHIIAALLPMYVVFPFADHLFGGGHSHSHHSHGHHYGYLHGLLDHVLGDILILTMILLPVALLTWLGHRLVKYVHCKCGTVHEKDPCESCLHKKA